MDPARAAQARQLYEQGRVYYDARRLADAALVWKKALDLDPTHKMARIKLEKLNQELNALAEDAFNRARRNFEYKSLDKAVLHWIYVMYLLPDPNNPLHRQSREGIQKVLQLVPDPNNPLHRQAADALKAGGGGKQ